MHDHWNELLERFWPSRRALPGHWWWPREATLSIAIAAAISLAAGPEIFAAMELTMLLELLGASLFLTAFSAGAKLAMADLWQMACRIAPPAPPMVVLRSDASMPQKLVAFAHVSAHAAWCLAFVLIVCAWGDHVLGLMA